MREYIFRGFHPDENGSKTITLNGNKIKGEWVYGAYDFNKEHKRGFIVSVGIDNIGPIAYIQEVIPETVGLWTGKEDINGNKIFEGNIVRFAEWSKGEMCWIGEIFFEYTMFQIKGGTNKECEGNFITQLSRIPSERIEVIGNKWQEVEE